LNDCAPEPRSGAPELLHTRGLEPHVESGAEDVSEQRDVAARQQAAIKPAVEVAEVDVEIFTLDAHVAHDAEFESGAHGPSGVGDAAAGKTGNARADVAERQAGGEIRQESIDRVADPRARRRQPRVATLAARRAEHVGRAFDAGPVDVALGANHELIDLPIVADGAADQPPGYIELVDAVPLGAPPAAPPVDAEIKAGPVVDRAVDRCAIGHGITRGYIRRPRGHLCTSQHADARNHETLHCTLLRMPELSWTVLRNRCWSSAR